MVFVYERIAESFIYRLIVRQFSTGFDGKYGFRNHFLAKPVIKFMAKLVNLVFPQVGSRGKGTGQIAIECAVPDGKLCLIGVAGKNAMELCRQSSQNTGRPVSGLYIFHHEWSQLQRSLAMRRGNGQIIQCRTGVLNKVSNRNGHIGAFQIFCQLAGKAFCGF